MGIIEEHIERTEEQTKQKKETIDAKIAAPDINSGITGFNSYEDEQKKLQGIKDEKFSVMNTSGAIWRTSVPFARQISQRETRASGLFGSTVMTQAGSPIDYNDPKVQDIYNSVDQEHWESLNGVESVEDLIAVRSQINTAKADMQYVSDQHGMGTSLALYGAASLLDPLTYVPIVGQSKKLYGAIKMANSMSLAYKSKLAGSIGGQVSLAAGVSEAMIQGTGERDYEAVPVTMAFAFALGSGATFAAATLKNVNIARKEDALSKLANTEMKIGDDVERTAMSLSEKEDLLDIIASDGAIKPIRSTASKILSTIIPHGKNKLITSPTYRAFMKGGQASSFARMVDTPAGLSSKEDGTIVKHVDNTVMDVKYQTYEDFIQLEISRHTSFKKLQKENPSLKEAEFTEAVWKETQKLRKQYESRVKKLETEIRESSLEDVVAEAQKKQDTVLDRKDFTDDESFTKAQEEGINKEIDLAVRREAIKRENELGIEDEISVALKPMIDAQSTYYGKMNKRMIDSGFDNADSYLPKYYSPIMYDVGAIKMGDEEEVVKAFETAIRNSPDFKEKVAAIDAKIETARNSDEKMAKHIAEKEKRFEKLLQSKERMSNLLDNSIAGDIHQPSGFGLQREKDIQFVVSKTQAARLKKIAGNDPFIAELEKLSGLRAEDLGVFHGKPSGLFDPNISRVALQNTLLNTDLSKKFAKENIQDVFRHEMIHAISTKLLNNSKEYASDIKSIMNEMLLSKKKFKDDFVSRYKGIMEREGRADLIDNANYDIGYMMKDEHEFLAQALGNRYLMEALNMTKSSVGIKKSLLDNILDSLKRLFGFKITKDSVLDKVMTSMHRNTQKNSDIASKEIAKELRNIRTELEQIQRKYDAGKASDKEFSRMRELQNMLTDASVRMRKSSKRYDKRIKEKINEIDTKIIVERQLAEERGDALLVEKINIEAQPRLQSIGMIDGIKSKTRIEQMGFEDIVPSALKKRTLDIDYTDPAIMPYMQTNEAQISQMYQYTMSGKISTQQVLGTSNREEMRAMLIKQGFDKKDLEMSMESFELALGTRQIPNDPDANWEKAVRTISHINYLTMGGQFAKSGLTEIGMGVYRAGFGYMRELVPALDNVIKMYRGEKLSQWADDARSMSEANSIYSNNFLSSYSDTDYIESTFQKGIENVLKKGSQKFFRYSGLEGVTTLTQIALPRAFLRRILKESKRGMHGDDLMRWGITAEDMATISKQPIVMKDGNIVDFNFDAWDKGVADKFMISTQRMSRDAIMRPDAVRLPTWVNDGGTNPMFKLAKQFMTFTMLSHERLMIAGMNENQAMAMVGASVSAAILIAMEKVGEELAVATGIMDDKDRYYTDEKEGWARLFKRAALRNPMMGNASTGIETYMDLTSDYGQGQAFTRVVGGPTGGRIGSAHGAIEDAISGKLGTRNQVNTLSSLIPGQNLIGVAAYTKHLKSDIMEYSKLRDYHQND